MSSDVSSKSSSMMSSSSSSSSSIVFTVMFQVAGEGEGCEEEREALTPLVEWPFAFSSVESSIFKIEFTRMHMK
jgi:hypothetical protein